MPEWIFDSTGGCVLCDDRDGYHDEKPDRPHSNCDCEIYVNMVAFGECFRVELEWDSSGMDYDFDDENPPPGPLELEYSGSFNYLIECISRSISFSGTLEYAEMITIPFYDDNRINELMIEYQDHYMLKALEDALKIAEEECECEEIVEEFPCC